MQTARRASEPLQFQSPDDTNHRDGLFVHRLACRFKKERPVQTDFPRHQVSSQLCRPSLREARFVQLCDRHGNCAAPFPLEGPAGSAFVADMLRMKFNPDQNGDTLRLSESSKTAPLPSMTGRRT
jgi:hypothetical protein